MQIVISHGSPTEDEAAALIAAVACVFEEQALVNPPAVAITRTVWRSAALLEAQGLVASRAADDAAWNRAGRAQRGRRWSRGIVGS